MSFWFGFFVVVAEIGNCDITQPLEFISIEIGRHSFDITCENVDLNMTLLTYDTDEANQLEQIVSKREQLQKKAATSIPQFFVPTTVSEKKRKKKTLLRNSETNQ